MKRVAVYAGSFDPFTIGHANIVQRALEIVDELHIVVGVNITKACFQPYETRVESLKELYRGDDRIKIVTYDGIVAKYAKQIGAVLIRGIRNVADLESERQLAEVNRKLFGIETICLFSDSTYSYVSSSLVRELATFGEEYSEFIPKRDNRYGY